MGRKAKTTLIKEEYDRIMAHYAELPENQMAIVEPLIQNAAFMKITLDDLPTCKPTTASSRITTP